MNNHTDQPHPFTPNLSRADVRQHAYLLFRDKIKDGHHLTTEDWVLAEKDLVTALQNDELVPGQAEGR